MRGFKSVLMNGIQGFEFGAIFEKRFCEKFWKTRKWKKRIKFPQNCIIYGENSSLFMS